MTNKYIAYNGIVIGAENWVKKDGGVEYTPYIFSEFSPNEVSTTFQKDDLITDGSEYSNYRYEPRIVSLRGHILPRKGESVEELRIKLYEKCGGKTAHRLMYSSSTHGYFAEAVADAPVTAKPAGAAAEFNINFTLPGFFWYDEQQTEIAAHTRIKNLPMPFTLPRSFGSTVSGATIINTNDFDIFPRVKIISDSNDKTESLELTNETTGKNITMTSYSITAGTQILIDCQSLTVTAGGVDILDYFNDFSDFALIPGGNQIKCTNNGLNQSLRVAVEFYRPYVGI